MQLDELKNALEKTKDFRMHNKIYQSVHSPKLASKILLARFKYNILKTTTLAQAELFFDERMTVRLPEVVSEALFLQHFFEYGLSKILLEILKSGMVFVDIGAHFGYYTLLASKILSQKGRVHSFEPSKKTFGVLCNNIDKKKNAQINNLAVWSTDTFLEFNELDERYSAFSSFSKPKLNNYEGTIRKSKIRAISLDSYFKDEYPDFVKIDAESSELEILKGMEKIIKEKKPIITLEVGDFSENKFSLSAQCIEYLLDRNYNVFEFKDGKIKPHNVKESYEFDNLLFLEENTV